MVICFLSKSLSHLRNQERGTKDNGLLNNLSQTAEFALSVNQILLIGSRAESERALAAILGASITSPREAPGGTIG